MAVKTPRHLVIDASIARAAGPEDSIAPKSIYCRRFLLEIRKCGHYIIMTHNINNEWNKHQSSFARSWLVSMVSRKQRIFINKSRNEELRQRVVEVVADAAIQEIIMKDIHMVEAAIVKDNLITSLDDRVKHHLQNLTNSIEELRLIIWINPIVSDFDCLRWINEGCKHEESLHLGYIKA